MGCSLNLYLVKKCTQLYHQTTFCILHNSYLLLAYQIVLPKTFFRHSPGLPLSWPVWSKRRESSRSCTTVSRRFIDLSTYWRNSELGACWSDCDWTYWNMFKDLSDHHCTMLQLQYYCLNLKAQDWIFNISILLNSLKYIQCFSSSIK